MIEELIDSTLIVLGKTGCEKISPRGVVSYRQLVEALLISDRLVDAAKYLHISEDTLFKSLSRYVSKDILGKPSNVQWKQFLLNLSNYKQCQRCGMVLNLSAYTKDSHNWDGYAYSCRDCKAQLRQSFTTSNPEYSKLHYLANKESYLANAGRYRARLGLAQPAWADVNKILQIYRECPEGYHIDHIFPLQSDWVCGLHVEYNLRAITSQENLKKSNKFIPEIHN